jgi:hypothetical protein
MGGFTNVRNQFSENFIEFIFYNVQCKEHRGLLQIFLPFVQLQSPGTAIPTRTAAESPGQAC